MGPHSFKCGSRCCSPLQCFRGSCFNGAALFQVRKSPRRPAEAPRETRFNGAALFQVRKFGWEVPCHGDASCFNGAALFQVRKCSCYKSTRQSNTRFNGAALFQVRKSNSMRFANLTRWSFNGAALFQVRKWQKRLRKPSMMALLQWGRTLSSAEVCIQKQWLNIKYHASMGPHSFKCGSCGIWFGRRNEN